MCGGSGGIGPVTIFLRQTRGNRGEKKKTTGMSTARSREKEKIKIKICLNSAGPARVLRRTLFSVLRFSDAYRPHYNIYIRYLYTRRAHRGDGTPEFLLKFNFFLYIYTIIITPPSTTGGGACVCFVSSFRLALSPV